MKIAMFSYNGIVNGEKSGWKNNGDNHLLLIQQRELEGLTNPDGTRWAVRGEHTLEEGLTDLFIRDVPPAREMSKGACQSAIDSLWRDLADTLPALDKVVFYVGSHGAERAIELAAKHGVTPDQAVFVRCDCNLAKKTELIRSNGFSTSKVLDCECGGHETMRRLYHDFLNGDHSLLSDRE